MQNETDKANDPLAKYANYRQEMQDAVDNGKGLGLFGPIFVALYDALKAARKGKATMSDHETVVPIPPTDTAEIVIVTKTEHDALTTTIATQAARIEQLEETLQFAATYKGIEGRGCPLCHYEDGVYIASCQMHKDMEMQAARIEELERMSEFWKKAALLARDEFVERGDELDRLRAELAEAKGDAEYWHNAYLDHREGGE